MLGDITILKFLFLYMTYKISLIQEVGLDQDVGDGGGVYSPVTNVPGCYVAVIDLLKLEGY